MTTPDDHLVLAAEFPAATREQWLKLVDGVLKGAPFDKKLVSHSYDDLPIAPLYPRDPRARPLPGHALGASWQVMQRVDHPDPAAANAETLHDLENGATGLSLVFAGAVGSYGYGLDASESTLARVLEGVHLDAGISLELDLSTQTKDAARALAAVIKRRGFSPAATDIRFGLDPIRALAAGGASPLRWSGIVPTFTGVIVDLATHEFRGPFAVADGRVVHAAGGSEAQELAYVLAVAVTYLRTLESGGIALDDARRMIFFRLAADADQFLTLAKFRALRKLWARVEEACGLAPLPAFVTAETAWRMLTRRDPYVNMLRATIAVFSAALGGANAISVLPHTAAIGLPDRFARRIARNTQLILLEESNLAKVADPAAGSGATEDLTANLCAAAWSLFQDIERVGGAWNALEQGLIQKKVTAVRAERERAVAKGKVALTGISAFPNINEAQAVVLDVAPVAPPPLFDVAAKAEPLVRMRLSEPFEKLRDASDRVLARTGARPKVFLANLGPIAAFTARAMFAKNFFEAGGIEAVTNDGFAFPSPLPVGERSAAQRPGEGKQDSLRRSNPSPDLASLGRPSPKGEVTSGEATTNLDALIAAFKSSGAKLACLCSSDEVYRAEAVAAATALTRAGANRVYLAGRPGNLEAALKAASVQGFVYAGGDVLETLRAAHDMLGIEACR